MPLLFFVYVSHVYNPSGCDSLLLGRVFLLFSFLSFFLSQVRPNYTMSWLLHTVGQYVFELSAQIFC